MTVTSFDDPILIAFRTPSATQVAAVTVSSQRYIGGEWVWDVARYLVHARFAPGAYVAEWDYLDDDGLPVSWTFEQTQVDFYLDGERVGTQALRRR